MKTLRNLALLGLLAVAIFGGRWLWFHQGSYRAPAIPTIDPAAIALPDVVYASAMDEPAQGDGRVVLDFSHANNVAVTDLTPLAVRLAARGVEVVLYDDGYDELAPLLQSVSAFLILAPTTEYAPEECALLQAFVEDGGRLLLAADPTHTATEEDEDASELEAALFPESAIPAINSIARRFGVVYFDDYLYNLETNAGNYRNVRLTEFDAEHTLTRDLESVVFFAAHSLRSDGRALVSGDAVTRSSVRTGETDLAAVTLSADDNVLALGDITFLTAPYHTQADNDRFLNHIADWLAVDNRQREDFEDFPYVFKQPVDLVQLGAEWLDPRLIVRTGELQAVFEAAGLTLELHAEADPAHDALLLGIFDGLTVTHPLLAEAGITVTLAAPEEEAKEAAKTDTDAEESAESLTTTQTITQGMVEIETLGTLALDGTSLLVMEQEAGRRTLLVLAENADDVAAALERLVKRNFAGCVETDAPDDARRILVCSTGEAPKETPTPKKEDKEDSADGEEAKGAILIIAADVGEGKRTGAPELKAILSADYAVKLWSIKEDGLPTPADLADYDAYLFAFGDYAMTPARVGVFEVIQNIEEGGIMLIGEQPLPGSAEEVPTAPLEDLQVKDADHPLMAGFSEDDILILGALENDIPAMVIPEDDEFATILVRGPDSAEADSPALVAGEDDPDNRYIIAGFAFYRLPTVAQRTLARNIAAWLLNE